MPHARIEKVPIEDRAAYSLGEVAGLIGMSVSGLYLLIGRANFDQSELVAGAWSLARRLTSFLRLSGHTPLPTDGAHR